MKIVIIGDVKNSPLGKMIGKKGCSCINCDWIEWRKISSRIVKEDIVIAIANPLFTENEISMPIERISDVVADCIEILQIDCSVCLISPPGTLSNSILSPSQLIRIPVIGNKRLIFNFFLTGVLFKINYTNGNKKHVPNSFEIIPQRLVDAIFDSWDDLLKLPIQPSLFTN